MDNYALDAWTGIKCKMTSDHGHQMLSVCAPYETWLILYSKFLENGQKYLHKWPNYWVVLRFCSRLDQNAFQKISSVWIFFLLKIIWNVCNLKKIKIGAKKVMVDGLHPQAQECIRGAVTADGGDHPPPLLALKFKKKYTVQIHKMELIYHKDIEFVGWIFLKQKM